MQSFLKKTAQSSCYRLATKKTDVLEHLMVFKHVGLLGNWPPGEPEYLLLSRPTTYLFILQVEFIPTHASILRSPLEK
jgi:hypothetical protein